jgi:hypothetical protein
MTRVLWHAVVGAAVLTEFMTVQCSVATLQENARLRRAMCLLPISIVFDLLLAIAVMYGVLRQVFQIRFTRVLSVASSLNLKFPLASLR